MWEFVEIFVYKVTFEFCLYPQTDGQTERTIQSLEDLLRAYVLEQGDAWDKFLSLIKFT